MTGDWAPPVEASADAAAGVCGRVRRSLFADEPTGALDHETAAACDEALILRRGKPVPQGGRL
ncbi:hypothetical protein ACIQ8D_02775 [Streptomyces sp. NPDC096094]|uniref:hypothetical protein n=1 Tax=Streptomyces sp. NPDC096094 TaxID=3366073 RepID=UPI0037FFB460